MNCLFCNKELENAIPEDMGYAPHKGGIIKFHFTYGSIFDNSSGYTEFDALICDGCAEKYVNKMKEKNFTFNFDPENPAYDCGPQKGPSSVNKIEAEVKQIKKELYEDT